MSNETLRQQLALLYKLQEHDRELLSIHKRFQAIPRQIKQLEVNVTQHNDILTQKSDELSEIEKSLRSKNADLEMNEVQREKYKTEQREVTTNEAYSALEKQIEFLDDKDADTEIEILELMESADQLKEELKKLDSEVADENEKIKAQTNQFKKEQKDLKAIIDEKMDQRTKFLPKIDKQLSKLYRRWMERQKGDFIALGKNGTCGSCQLTIQPQNLKEAQKYEKLVYCASCKRVLYVEPLSSEIPYP